MKSNKRILQWENHSNISSPPLKNHTTTLIDNYLYIFGGYDGRKNYSTIQVFDTKNLEWIPQKFYGEPPESRNGHTATLVDRTIYIIGGWIESIPSAGKDVHRLDVDKQSWIPTPQSCRAPVCNMHTADYIPHLNMIFVFRGGDGREYLNDLHTYDIASLDWVEMEVAGTPPTKRANHSSARVNNYLYIFGGWNGRERLNDLYILDTVTLSWSQPICEGFLPQPRAGMSLTVVDDELFLFGGNGPSSQRYDDLRILSSELTFNSDHQNIITNNNDNNNNNNNKHDQNIYSTVNNHSRTFVWKVCLGVNEYSLLSSLSYESAGGSMQDGDSDLVQSNISSYSLTCPFCISGNTSNNNFVQKQYNPTESITSTSQTSKPLCPHCNRCIIQVRGTGPGKRAGHTATAVGTRIFFIGGGFGSEYVQNIHILDTDACLRPEIISPTCHNTFQSKLRTLFNSEELADVVFVFPNPLDGKERRIYAHRFLLSLTCPCFKAMFTSGCLESFQTEIRLEHTDYTSFLSLLEYLYTGEPPTILKSYLDKIQSHSFEHESVIQRNNSFLSTFDEFNHYGNMIMMNNQSGNIDHNHIDIQNNNMIDDNYQMNQNNNNINNDMSNDNEEDIPNYLLEVLNILDIVDEYFCSSSQNYLKEVCEVILSHMVTFQSVEYIYLRAERSNAYQLQEVCQHVIRSMKTLQYS